MSGRRFIRPMRKIKAQIQWIVKDKKEKIHGPYSTREVLESIRGGEFVGTEQVARYPGGTWVSISENPAFYDQLLASLEEVIDIPMPDPKTKVPTKATQSHKGNKASNSNKTSDKSHNSADDRAGRLYKKGEADFDSAYPPPPQEESGEKPGPPEQGAGAQKLPKQQASGDGGIGVRGVRGVHGVNGRLDSPSPLHIELKKEGSIQQEIRKTQKRRFLLVMALVLVSIACMAVLFPDLFENKKSSQFHLLRPRKGQKPMGSQEKKTKFLKALQLFQRDEMESYMRAQDILVQLVERSPRHAESKGLLCVTYRLLWPFAYQDSQDLKTVGFVAMLAKKEDPTEVHSVLCDLIHLMLRRRWKNVNNLLYQALNNYQESTFLYQMKGELLMNEKNHETALNYTEQSLQIWPKWIHAHLQRAQILQHLNQNKKALEVYQAVLKKHPEHLKAKVLLGKLYYHSFKETLKAIPLLTDAVKRKKLLHPLLKASALAILAEYFMKQGQSKKALDMAKASFRLNSRNEKIRRLLSQLGGREDVSKSRESSSAFVTVAEQFIRSGNYLAAHAELKAALDRNPKDASLSFLLAQCLWKLHRPQNALFYLNQTLKHRPDFVDAYILQADYLSRQFEYAAAQRALKKAQRIEKKNHLVFYGYALLSFRQNDLKATRQFAELALKIYSLHTKSLVLIGKVFFKKGNLEKASQYVIKAIELDFTMEEAHSLYIKILAKLQGKDAAVHYIQSLIKEYPYVENYLISLAEILNEEQRYEDALAQYKTAHSISPKNKEALMGMGHVYKSLDKPDEAIQSYFSAALLNPSDAEPILSAGLLYMGYRRYHEAIRQFKRVLRINAKYPRVYYYIGRSYLWVGQLDKALEFARKENQNNPNLSDPYLLSAQVHTLKKQYRACLSEYQKALRFQDQGAVVYVKMAHCHRLSGNLEAAEDLLRVAKGKESALPEIYQEAGAVYEMKKDHCAAVIAYQRYIHMKPNASNYRQIQNKIAQMKRENPLEFQSCGL